MGKNEIRLRRQRMSSGRIAQHRNYDEIMARHERNVRWKRLIRIFTYVLIVLVMTITVLMVLFLFKRLEQQSAKPKSAQSAIGTTTDKNLSAERNDIGLR